MLIALFCCTLVLLAIAIIYIHLLRNQIDNLKIHIAFLEAKDKLVDLASKKIDGGE